MTVETAHAETPWQRLGNRFTLGLRARAEADWLREPDAFADAGRRADQLAEKAWLLDNRHDEVFAASPDSLDAAREVLEMVAASFDDGAVPTQEDIHPLEMAARMVPEDLLLLAPRQRDGSPDVTDWVLVAAALAFPAHWVLAEKMGRPLAEIHGPVPHYGELLERPMDRFFTNMKVGPVSHRWNWSVVTTDRLFTPHRMRRTPLAAGAGIEDIFIRMESQTLRKLARTGHVLFTIRTYVEPLSRWAAIPGALASLAELLDGMTPQMRAYKGVELFEDALKTHLGAPKQPVS